MGPRALVALLVFAALGVAGTDGQVAPGIANASEPLLVLDLVSFAYPVSYTILREYYLSNATLDLFPWSIPLPDGGEGGQLIDVGDGCDGLAGDIGSQFATLQPNLTIVALVHGMGPVNVSDVVAGNSSTNATVVSTPVSNTTTTGGNITSDLANVTSSNNTSSAAPRCTFADKVAALLANKRVSLVIVIENVTAMTPKLPAYRQSLNYADLDPATGLPSNVTLFNRINIPMAFVDLDGGGRVANLLKVRIGGNGEGKVDTTAAKANGQAPPTLVLFATLLADAAAFFVAPGSPSSSQPSSGDSAVQTLYRNAFFVSAIVLSCLSVIAFGLAVWRRRQMRRRYLRARALYEMGGFGGMGARDDGGTRALTPAELERFPVSTYTYLDPAAKPPLARTLSARSGVQPAAAPAELVETRSARALTPIPEGRSAAPSRAASRAASRIERDQRSVRRLSTSSMASNSPHPHCAVCLERFKPGVSKVRTLPCNHIFDVECIDQWLVERSGVCPVCRMDLTTSPLPEAESAPASPVISIVRSTRRFSAAVRGMAELRPPMPAHIQTAGLDLRARAAGSAGASPDSLRHGDTHLDADDMDLESVRATGSEPAPRTLSPGPGESPRDLGRSEETTDTRASREDHRARSFRRSSSFA